MDLFEKLVNKQGPIGMYSSAAHGYYTFPKLIGELGSRMEFQEKEHVIWSINDYLGLANHPTVRRVDAEAAREWGMAYPMGSRMMSGETKYHEQLERELSDFIQKEDVFLLNYGYQGIMSIIDALTDRHDVIVYDKECHACIYDGVRLHLGNRYAFEHNDLVSFCAQMKKAAAKVQSNQGGILVITEGVFGMRGEQGILKEIIEQKKHYDFKLLVDDAHGFGTLGQMGTGTGEEQGVQDQIDLYFGTFAKSMAGIGGFLGGDKNIIHYLRYNTRSQIFAKSLPMPMVIGALQRLKILRSHPELRERLWNNVKLLQEGLKSRGFDIGQTNSCVTPVYLEGSVPEAMALIHDLREQYGIFCSIVVYPVIPMGMILIRLIPTAAHTDKDIQQTLYAFSEVVEKLNFGYYKKRAIKIQ